MPIQPSNKSGRNFTRNLHKARVENGDRPLGKLPKQYTSPADDAVLLLCKELAPILISWIAEYDAVNYVEGRNSFNGDIQISGLQYIMEWSGVPQRTIFRILHREQKWVTVTIADKLLTAMGLQHKLDDLNQVVNPRWSAAKWEEYRKASCDD